jgi:hypothetical protein
VLGQSSVIYANTGGLTFFTVAAPPIPLPTSSDLLQVGLARVRLQKMNSDTPPDIVVINGWDNSAPSTVFILSNYKIFTHTL